MNGNFFTKTEEAETRRFLNSIGLNKDQTDAVTLWHKSQLTAQLNLWIGVFAIIGVAIGLLLGSLI